MDQSGFRMHRQLYVERLRRYTMLVVAPGQPGNGNEHLLPSIQFNINGEVVLLPGEPYCRYRHGNNSVCPYRWEIGLNEDMRSHYLSAHNIRAEPIQAHHWTTEFLDRVGDWYIEVVTGYVPTWLPRTESDTPLLNIYFPLPQRDEAIEQRNQNGDNRNGINGTRRAYQNGDNRGGVNGTRREYRGRYLSQDRRD
ncbi:hypothetical protein HDV63DRAFT_85266 [Trichoderma sp. SZMC 28014]